MASVTSLGVHEPAGLRFAIAEGILPADASADLYDWKVVADDNGDDELFTTRSCVIWSRGGEVGRCLRFDMEKEPISTALLAYFPTSEDDVRRRYDTAAMADGPAKPPLPSNTAAARPKKKMPPALAKSLVVFLRTQAHVYTFSGGDHVVHMPFEVDAAMAAPVGVIIQRKSKVDTTVPVTLKFPRVPPNSFVSSQILPSMSSDTLTAASTTSTAAAAAQTFSTAGLGKPKPLPLRLSSTLDAMWDTPLESSDAGWPRLVCLTDPMSEIGLVVTQPGRPSKDRYPRSAARTPFLDPAEEILHVEAIRQDGGMVGGGGASPDDLILAVTVNRETSMYSVWRMTYLDAEDQFTRHRHKTPRTKTSSTTRRRSSAVHALASGPPTPHMASFRESLGPPQTMKKLRKSERLDKDQHGALERALSMESGRPGDVSRRQSRRVSSLLARADLSASHERPLFAEAPPHTSSVASAGRRVDSHGNQRGRSSSGYGLGVGGGGGGGGGGSGSGGGGGGNLPFNQTLNSLMESPVDGLLEELRSGGDFEGFHSMGLDDPEFDGLSKEVLFTRIHSMSMDTTNLRYSLSSQPATSLCKVFVIVGTPYSVDEQDRNYLLVCIQDAIDKRLQLLTLHVQLRGGSESGDGRDAAVATSITWGQHRRAQNVADSCVIRDGGQAMIFILSESDQGQRQLSIQAPWSELTTISVPPLSLHNRDRLATSDEPGIFQAAQAGRFGVTIAGLRRPRPQGVVDVVDTDGRSHQVQIQLEPRSAHVRRVLNVLRSILPAAHAEKVVLGWWQLMQWLGNRLDVAPDPDREWTALVVELAVIFLAALHPGAVGPSAEHAAQQAALFSLPSRSHLALPPAWAMSKAWNWVVDDDTSSAAVGSCSDVSGDRPLSEPIRLARAFMATESGEQAVGHAGYLPTALGVSTSARQTAVRCITMALHLYLEEWKLDILAAADGCGTATNLRVVVHQLCTWLGWTTFAATYALELPGGLDGPAAPDTSCGVLSLPEPDSVPSVLEWARQRLLGLSVAPFPSLRDVFSVLAHESHKEATRSDAVWQQITPRTHMLRAFFDSTRPHDPSARVVELMHRCGVTAAVLDSLPPGLATPFHDAIARCQQRPPGHWTRELYELVGRGDMNTVLTPDVQAARAANRLLAGVGFGSGASADADAHGLDDDDPKTDLAAQVVEEPESEERQAVIQALFREDKRLCEAQTLLSTSKPRVVRLNPQPHWSEPEYLERQKELVTTVATSTLATSAGRGMLNYGFRFPLLTQKFNVQGFNLTCIVQPTNVAVGVDKALFTEERVNWAFFHQGVAYGLAISARAKGIDTSWIVFNKPGTDLSHRHAGFLLALGLNGHLKAVAKWVAFKYLTPKHMMTSIGLLLGLAASHIGTMDSLITRLLSVHVTRMLPRGAAELNLSYQIQTTGIMGIGLLYYNSQHRRMSEIMLSEIAYMDDDDDEDPLRNEGYRLAAAFALGFINLGKGSDRKGLLDMQITEQLLSLATAAKKVELVNVLDRAAAAATVAIALIYLKTGDAMVARKIDIPDAALQFDYVRPDVLLLRTVASHLIRWHDVDATFDWIRARLPPDFRTRYRLDDVVALRSIDLPFFAILTGLCFAAALRFAGSGNVAVRDLLIHYLDRLLAIVQTLPAEHYDAQIARSGARMCLDVLALSSATVMAGTGDIIVLRRLRALHGRDDAHTTYGSHMAAHLSIGTLFLGSGTTTLANTHLAVAALLVAFYPIFPTTIQDNGSHLQAFRHFWVLATEPRCLVTKDVATGQPISVPILLRLRSTALSQRTAASSALASSSTADILLRRQTPCLLPPLDDIIAVRTDAAAQGFWDLEIGFDKDPSLRAAFRANQNLYLRRRPPHDNVFTTTLQVLSAASDGGGAASATGAFLGAPGRGGGDRGGGGGGGHKDPLEWLFNLELFKSLGRAERAMILGTSGLAADHGGGGGGGVPSLSSTIDARLALVSSLDSWSRDSLLDLRLLFDWADQRERLRDGDNIQPADDGNEKTPAAASGLAAEAATDMQNSTQAPWLRAPSKRADWWISDSAIDILKGQAWLVGQEEAEEEI